MWRSIDTPLIMNRFPSFNSVTKPRKFALPRLGAKKMLNHKMSFPLASNNLQLVFPPKIEYTNDPLESASSLVRFDFINNRKINEFGGKYIVNFEQI